MTNLSLDCCKRILVSCTTSEIFGAAISIKMHQINCKNVFQNLKNSHRAKNSSTASAVSSYTLSNVPITSLATLLRSGACCPARDLKIRAFLLATFFITLTKPASLRRELPYSLRMCGLQKGSEFSCKRMTFGRIK